ncbi:MAG: alpha/beta hydrolase [Cyanobacteriota bacterium]
MGYFSFAQRLSIGLIALVGVFLGNAPAQAAQTVVLKYRFFRESVSVPELTRFVETGELSRSLRFYLRVAKKEPAELRNALTQEVKVNPLLMYRVLNTSVGEVMLDRASEVVHTPTNRANRESLRGALVSSALPDGNITLLETLQNYPTPEVHVEGDRLVEFTQNIRGVLGRLPNIKL